MNLKRHIGRDTRLCMSLSARPGTFGSRFHNHLYEALDLDYVYKAFNTTDLAGAVSGIRALGIRGCAVSMPFKEACIPMLDSLAPSAAAIGAVNTIVNDDGHLRGYNTDYTAVAQLLRTRKIAPDTSFALRGSGGMAKAVLAALRDAGFQSGLVIARNETTGRGLAGTCGYEWQAELGESRPGMLINVTPIGMTGGPEAGELAFSKSAIDAARVVFDVVAVPSDTPLICHARARGTPGLISGAEVIVLQAVEQFVLYTGRRPSPEQIQRAAEFALG